MGFAPGGVGLADLGDLDGDGDLDLVLKHSFANTISVLFNQGNGTFAGRSTYAVGDGPTGLALGDLNGDGYLDVVVSNYWSNSISVLINQGDNTFGDQRTYVTGSGPLRIVTVDLDGDGDLDLAYTTDEAGTVSVWFNRGDATFDDPANHSIPLASGMSPLVAGDLDGDGDMDLVAGNRNTGDIAILLNRGNGSFDVRTFSTDGQPRLLALGDLDVSGDGALDLVILSDLRSRANAPEVVVLLNR